MMDRRLTYLACPYSHPSRDVRVERFEAANKAAAILMRQGHLVFSPISHTHPIAEAGDLPLGWDFWEAYDRAFLVVSRRLVVLQLEGWMRSVGVTAEIKIAEELGVPITLTSLVELEAQAATDEQAAFVQSSTNV